MTQAFGINDSGEVAGAYTVGSGSSAKTYGFTWTHSHGFNTVNDPHGIGTTLINGINDRGELVGFYTDGAGNVDGFLARPSATAIRPAPLAGQTAVPPRGEARRHCQLAYRSPGPGRHGVVKIGVVFPQTEIGGDAAPSVRTAQRVEELGFTHLLAYDHVLGADPAVHEGWTGPYDVDTTFHEPFVLFGYLAAHDLA